MKLKGFFFSEFRFIKVLKKQRVDRTIYFAAGLTQSKRNNVPQNESDELEFRKAEMEDYFFLMESAGAL